MAVCICQLRQLLLLVFVRFERRVFFLDNSGPALLIWALVSADHPCACGAVGVGQGAGPVLTTAQLPLGSAEDCYPPHTPEWGPHNGWGPLDFHVNALHILTANAYVSAVTEQLHELLSCYNCTPS